MAQVKMYSTRHCPFCIMATRLLQEKGVDIDIQAVDSNPALRQEMEQLSQRTSVPQIFINGNHIGGYRELQILEEDGELDIMLSENAA